MNDKPTLKDAIGGLETAAQYFQHSETEPDLTGRVKQLHDDIAAEAPDHLYQATDDPEPDDRPRLSDLKTGEKPLVSGEFVELENFVGGEPTIRVWSSIGPGQPTPDAEYWRVTYVWNDRAGHFKLAEDRPRVWVHNLEWFDRRGPADDPVIEQHVPERMVSTSDGDSEQP